MEQFTPLILSFRKAVFEEGKFNLCGRVSLSHNFYLVYGEITRAIPPPPGGRGSPQNKLHRYVPPQRVRLKTVIDFDHLGLKSGMVFK